jgi:hypothetical protein
VADLAWLLSCLRALHWTRSRRSEWLCELSARVAQGLVPDYRVAKVHYDTAQERRKGRRKSITSMRNVVGACVRVAELPPGTPLTPSLRRRRLPRHRSAARAAAAA